MKTDLERTIRTGIREYADTVRVVPPPFVAPAPRQRRLGWLAPALVATAVLTIVAAVAMVPVHGPVPATTVPGSADGPPSLPIRFAGYSRLTAPLSTAPLGRAIAAYEYSVVDTPIDAKQSLLVSADRAGYRQADPDWTGSGSPWGPSGTDPAPVLLAPDGTALAFAAVNGKPGVIGIVNLATGEVVRHPVTPGADVTALAWSADGHRLAYLMHGAVPPPSHSTVLDLDPARTAAQRSTSGRLAVLDLDSGRSTIADPAITAAVASFAPDGTSLAVQDGPGQPIRILDPATLAVRHEAPVSSVRYLAGPAAWSPDGRLLALAQGDPTDQGLPVRISVVDPATMNPWPNAVDVTESVIGFLGWRSPTTLLYQRGGQPNLVIAQVPVTGGRSEAMATFVDEARHDRHLSDLQLAYGLLPDLVIRPADSDADHGPWPTWLRLTVVVAGAVLAGLAWLVWRSIRRRRGSCPTTSRS
ncbi:WD40 repeat domain-containing protein [Micromonospora sp. NBC_01638]|uniref:WD40 repeat domain-containing protein n=1 Tax=Micromonospora sp. NBC_01638 TaxID=2975982 RepID=UPI00386DD09B|nr:hypothetical protein OG811_01700 [Micromonospora sp. NBC_01638]